MRSYFTLADLDASDFVRPTAVTIGKFDGVHLGHHSVLQQLTVTAAEHNLEPVVFTFTDNPLKTIAPEKCPPPLSSPKQRLERIAEQAIAATVMVDFDDALRNLTPAEYASRVLCDTMRAQWVQVGSDFRFGRGGSGTVDTLMQLGDTLGFQVAVTDDVIIEGARVSSSRIRELLAAGDVAAAAKLLGRPQELRATVVQGAKRGRELGFPTANLAPDYEGLAPCDGVYAGWARVGADGKRYPAAISVGSNPTFTPEAATTVEVFLLDFSGDLYGETLTVTFTERIRGMRTFASVTELISVMREDVATIAKLLGCAPAM